jgi:transcriptional regulator with XRE-family HTH domain
MTIKGVVHSVAAVLGDVLRDARREAGLTQEAAAARAGMDRAYVSLVEQNRSSPTVERLFRLCEAIGVRPSVVLARVEREKYGESD